MKQDGKSVRVHLHGGVAKAKTLSVNEAAAYTGLGRQTLRREIERGRLKAIRLGRVKRIAITELDRFIEDIGATGADLSVAPPAPDTSECSA